MIYSISSLNECVEDIEEFDYNSVLSSFNKDSLLEDAYMYLYESDYNFNTIVNEINFHEAKAAEMDCVLVLEAADIKGFFTKIKNWIKETWRKFVNWLKAIRDKIKDFFTKGKSSSKKIKEKRKDKKKVKEALDKAKSKNKEIKGKNIDQEGVKTLVENVKKVDIDPIKNAETIEEVKEKKQEISQSIINDTKGKASTNESKSMIECCEKAVGLKEEVNIIEKYTPEEISESSEVKNTASIDEIAKIGSEIAKEADKTMDEAIKIQILLVILMIILLIEILQI